MLQKQKEHFAKARNGLLDDRPRHLDILGRKVIVKRGRCTQEHSSTSKSSHTQNDLEYDFGDGSRYPQKRRRTSNQSYVRPESGTHERILPRHENATDQVEGNLPTEVVSLHLKTRRDLYEHGQPEDVDSFRHRIQKLTEKQDWLAARTSRKDQHKVSSPQGYHRGAKHREGSIQQTNPSLLRRRPILASPFIPGGENIRSRFLSHLGGLKYRRDRMNIEIGGEKIAPTRSSSDIGANTSRRRGSSTRRSVSDVMLLDQNDGELSVQTKSSVKSMLRRSYSNRSIKSPTPSPLRAHSYPISSENLSLFERVSAKMEAQRHGHVHYPQHHLSKKETNRPEKSQSHKGESFKSSESFTAPRSFYIGCSSSTDNDLVHPQPIRHSRAIQSNVSEINRSTNGQIGLEYLEDDSSQEELENLRRPQNELLCNTYRSAESDRMSTYQRAAPGISIIVGQNDKTDLISISSVRSDNSCYLESEIEGHPRSKLQPNTMSDEDSIQCVPQHNSTARSNKVIDSAERPPTTFKTNLDFKNMFSAKGWGNSADATNMIPASLRITLPPMPLDSKTRLLAPLPALTRQREFYTSVEEESKAWMKFVLSDSVESNSDIEKSNKKTPGQATHPPSLVRTAQSQVANATSSTISSILRADDCSRITVETRLFHRNQEVDSSSTSFQHGTQYHTKSDSISSPKAPVSHNSSDPNQHFNRSPQRKFTTPFQHHSSTYEDHNSSTSLGVQPSISPNFHEPLQATVYGPSRKKTVFTKPKPFGLPISKSARRPAVERLGAGKRKHERGGEVNASGRAEEQKQRDVYDISSSPIAHPGNRCWGPESIEDFEDD